MKQRGPRKRAFLWLMALTGIWAPSESEPQPMLWHREGSAGYGVSDFLLASHLSAGDFFMRRSSILAGATAAVLVASSPAPTRSSRCSGFRSAFSNAAAAPASASSSARSPISAACCASDGMPEDRYVATIRKVGLDLGITQELALAWGVFAPVGAAWARRSLRQLCRRAGQRVARRRRRRQRAGRRFGEFDRAAAAERARPDRPQCRGRAGKPGTYGPDGNERSSRSMRRRRPTSCDAGSACFVVRRFSVPHRPCCTAAFFPLAKSKSGRASDRRPNQGPSSR